MGIQILQKRVIATEKNIKGSHLLCVLSDATSKTFPFVKDLDRQLKRAHKKMGSLSKEPVTNEAQDGRL